MPGPDESTPQRPSTEGTPQGQARQGGEQSDSPQPDTAAGEPVTEAEDLSDSEKAVAGAGSYEGVPMSDDELSDVWQAQPGQAQPGD